MPGIDDLVGLSAVYAPVGKDGADWRCDATCTSVDPELFFPIGTGGPALLQIDEAKAFCRRCPVIVQCLQWALESNQHHGVWGGRSEDERRAIKRRIARERIRTTA
ncbi:WhiB family transcriptional regulator [Streptomyces sp. NPDC126514]|uniref:WhiB family transcriptional regulator n=1 Tax=Streptomyces sp. NPDC126514 TaxID=3155210 RepID=UPI00332DF9D6